MHQPLLEIFRHQNVSGVAYKNKSLKGAIIAHLDSATNATIADLTRELNISTPKIINLINELIQDNLIKDYGKVDSTGGRRANMYGLESKAGYFVGIDVKRYTINAGLLNFKKQLITIEERIPYKLENSQEAFEQLILTIQEFISSLPVERDKILSVCINLSGRINNKRGIVTAFFIFRKNRWQLPYRTGWASRCFWKTTRGPWPMVNLTRAW